MANWDAEELQRVWGTAPGQMWRIPSRSGRGEHRIICGDATQPNVVARVMGGERADISLADPPYGVGINYKSTNDTRQNTMRLAQATIPLLVQYSEMIFWMSGGITMLCWYYQNIPPDWIIVWYKGSPGHRSFVGFNDWELVLVYGKRKGVRMHDFLRVHPERRGKYGHPAHKPVKWAEWFVKRAAGENGIVLDPFLGSGTTIVACENLGRQGRGIEIEPAYVAITLQRLSDLGLKPELMAGDNL